MHHDERRDPRPRATPHRISQTTLRRLYEVIVVVIPGVPPGSATYRALCQARTALEEDLDLPRTPTRRRPGG